MCFFFKQNIICFWPRIMISSSLKLKIGKKKMQFEWWRPDFMRHIFRNGKFWSEFCCMILWLASFARVAVCAFGKSLPIFQVCGFQLNAWINHSNFAKGSNCHQHSTAIVTGFCENRQEIINLFCSFFVRFFFCFRDL